ncbi:MAG: hypothetical protein ACRCRW_05515 [Aeromonadaceae bacterium]
MYKITTVLLSLALLGSVPAHAINAKYRQQLEHSGCTQVSEMQGCDIHKSKAENAKAGFVNEAAAPAKTGNSYKDQLERSGCTQASELQGCDIHKSKAENAQAGFVSGEQSQSAASSGSPYAGQWVAKADSGATVATIRIDAKDQVWVNGKKVKAKKSDGALIFRDGMITYTIQGDRRLTGEDSWHDTDADTRGPIHAE